MYYIVNTLVYIKMLKNHILISKNEKHCIKGEKRYFQSQLKCSSLFIISETIELFKSFQNDVTTVSYLVDIVLETLFIFQRILVVIFAKVRQNSLQINFSCEKHLL